VPGRLNTKSSVLALTACFLQQEQEQQQLID
jgi:hypothetical protein